MTEELVCTYLECLITLKGKQFLPLWGFDARVELLRKEYDLGTARADFLLQHDIDKFTLFEVKKAGFVRDIMTGIGQLLHQRMLLQRRLPGAKVDMALVVGHENNDDILLTCHSVGIKYIPLEMTQFMKTAVIINNIVAERT